MGRCLVPLLGPALGWGDEMVLAILGLQSTVTDKKVAVRPYCLLCGTPQTLQTGVVSIWTLQIYVWPLSVAQQPKERSRLLFLWMLCVLYLTTSGKWGHLWFQHVNVNLSKFLKVFWCSIAFDCNNDPGFLFVWKILDLIYPCTHFLTSASDT